MHRTDRKGTTCFIMPELPEVQTIVDDLKAAGLVGATVTDAAVYWQRSVVHLDPDMFCRRVRGKILADIHRRGKYIVFTFTDGDCLLLHLRMSGRLYLTQPGAARSKHEHVIIDFDNKLQLRLHDTRKFGRLILTGTPDTIVSRLGPEPLDEQFSPQILGRGLRAKKRRLKPLLLDQTFIAGLGNIYVDEALWEAQLHPCRISSTLTTSEVRRLHRAIRHVLTRGLRNLGTSLGTGKPNFHSLNGERGRNQYELNAFRRTGLPCPRCGTLIARLVVGQRSTHICPACQHCD